MKKIPPGWQVYKQWVTRGPCVQGDGSVKEQVSGDGDLFETQADAIEAAWDKYNVVQERAERLRTGKIDPAEVRLTPAQRKRILLLWRHGTWSFRAPGEQVMHRNLVAKGLVQQSENSMWQSGLGHELTSFGEKVARTLAK